MHRFRPVIAGVIGLVALGIAAAPMDVARGGGAIFVTTTDDELNADGDCSLREAVVALNTEAVVDACEGATGSRNVFADPGIYALTIAGAGEDAGATGDLDILRPISIDPTGQGQIVIDGGGLDRIFDIHPSAITFRTVLRSVVLRNGDAGTDDGGAIRVSDVACDGSPGSYRDVELAGVVLDSNRAARGGGLHIGSCNLVTILGSSFVRNTATDVGGGFSIQGDSIISFETSTISTNEAGVAGGGAWGDLVQDSAWGFAFSTIADNRAPNAGGIWSQQRVWADSSIVAANVGGNCGGPGGAFAAVSDDDSCGGPSEGDARLLGLTAINGVFVHPISSDSPAVERAGEPINGGGEWCGSYGPFDQAGTLRPLDGDGDGIAMCDAGAFEASTVEGLTPSQLPNTSVMAAAPRQSAGTPYLALVGAVLLGGLVVRRTRRTPPLV